jgi:UDPglucose 6-dehydrogenase
VRDFELPYTSDLDEAVEDADAIILSTRHKEYLKLNLKALKKKLATPILIDGRNAFREEDAARAGFTYRGVGKGKTKTRSSGNQ